MCRPVFVAIAVALAVAGCGLTEGTPEEAPEESTTESGLFCPIIACGENAATAGDGLLFDELDLFGRPNYAGVAMVGAKLASGIPVKLHIWLDELYAYDTATGTWYSGFSLLGMIIRMVHGPTGEPFELRLDGYNNQTVTFRSGAPEHVPAYDFKARRAGSTQFKFSICNNGILPVDPTWAGLPRHALLYRGDRYDPVYKRLAPNNTSDGWSFIACNGSAASKLHLWRHTYAGGFDNAGNPTYMTTLDQRTSLLKAITDDFCGTGAPAFTVAGTRLAFATAREPWTFPLPVASIEALWGPNGAYCIDRPRREGAGVARSDVETACGRPFPRCGPIGATWPPPGWWTGAYALTGNPPP